MSQYIDAHTRLTARSHRLYVVFDEVSASEMVLLTLGMKEKDSDPDVCSMGDESCDQIRVKSDEPLWRMVQHY